MRQTSDASRIYHATASAPSDSGMRACNCIGPQNGAPACPCMMPAHNRRVAGERALEFMTIWRAAGLKPRIRVKAGSKVTP